MKKYINKKSIIIASVMLLLLATVGTTLAYIFTETNPVENTFNPSKVACAVVENNGTPVTGSVTDTGNVKENVQIKNTGDTDAYIRVAVVVNWMSEDGTKVWATKPVKSTDGTDGDYTISYAENTGWEKGSDGYRYYTKSVLPTDGSNLTGILISEAKVLKNAPQEGYYLSIEIVASAIQAKPTSVVTSQWGVTVANDGSISKKGD